MGWHTGKCARASRRFLRKVNPMLRAALGFLVVALVAAFLGFGGIAGEAAGFAKILFVVFLVVAAVSLLLGRRTI